MSDGSVVVCQDFLNDETNGSPQLSGRRFLNMSDAFVKPYRSSDFGIFLGSNLSKCTQLWPASQVTAKIFAFPRRPGGTVNIDDANQEWYLLPIRHTIRNTN